MAHEGIVRMENDNPAKPLVLSRSPSVEHGASVSGYAIALLEKLRRDFGVRNAVKLQAGAFSWFKLCKPLLLHPRRAAIT